MLVIQFSMLVDCAVRLVHLPRRECRVTHHRAFGNSTTVTRLFHNTNTFAPTEELGDYAGTGFTDHVRRHETLETITFSEVKPVFVTVTIDLSDLTERSLCLKTFSHYV